MLQYNASGIFLHLQRALIHHLVQLQVISSIHESGTGARDISVGISDASSILHLIVFDSGRSGYCSHSCLIVSHFAGSGTFLLSIKRRIATDP